MRGRPRARRSISQRSATHRQPSWTTARSTRSGAQVAVMVVVTVAELPQTPHHCHHPDHHRLRAAGRPPRALSVRTFCGGTYDGTRSGHDQEWPLRMHWPASAEHSHHHHLRAACRPLRALSLRTFCEGIYEGTRSGHDNQSPHLAPRTEGCKKAKWIPKLFHLPEKM